MDWSLYDQQGHRKYLTDSERKAFVEAAAKRDSDVRTFCYVLKDTGCRLSEALELTAGHQRLQRENPEHPDAKKGFEELFLSRLNELKSVRKRNLGVVLRYGGIGAVSVVVICYILDLTIGRGNGLTFDQIIGLSIIGITIGVIAGSIVVFFKYGSPKLRIKTE